mmetsp:Transcript_1349/g.3087  ORF Transcript_1349/g.3087 Transcript_1349/m.3087 type:complete len:210 (+) Transcript_1349:5555-6184(+)
MRSDRRMYWIRNCSARSRPFLSRNLRSAWAVWFPDKTPYFSPGCATKSRGSLLIHSPFDILSKRLSTCPAALRGFSGCSTVRKMSASVMWRMSFRRKVSFTRSMNSFLFTRPLIMSFNKSSTSWCCGGAGGGAGPWTGRPPAAAPGIAWPWPPRGALTAGLPKMLFMMSFWRATCAAGPPPKSAIPRSRNDTEDQIGLFRPAKKKRRAS